MKSDKEIIEQAISELIGDVNIGCIVAHPSHKLAHTLIDVVGNIGICELPDGSIHEFLICELFDANKVKRRAIEITLEQAFVIDRDN